MSKKAATVRRLLGEPGRVASELRDFQQSAETFSSNHPRLIEQYPKQWVAVHGGKVQASAKTYRLLLARLERQGIPAAHTIVRYIDTNRRTMIL